MSNVKRKKKLQEFWDQEHLKLSILVLRVFGLQPRKKAQVRINCGNLSSLKTKSVKDSCRQCSFSFGEMFLLGQGLQPEFSINFEVASLLCVEPCLKTFRSFLKRPSWELLLSEKLRVLRWETCPLKSFPPLTSLYEIQQNQTLPKNRLKVAFCRPIILIYKGAVLQVRFLLSSWAESRPPRGFGYTFLYEKFQPRMKPGDLIGSTVFAVLYSSLNHAIIYREQSILALVCAHLRSSCSPTLCFPM